MDWPKHLPQVVHVYNSTRLAITRYSLHYFMFRCWLYLSIDFYSSQWGAKRNTNMLITMLPKYINGCGKPLKQLRYRPCQRHRDRSGTMIEKLTPFHWKHVAWSWLKPMPTGGEGKWRTSGRRNLLKWSIRLLRVSLPTLWKTSRQDACASSTKTDLFSLPLHKGLLPVWLYT